MNRRLAVVLAAAIAASEARGTIGDFDPFQVLIQRLADSGRDDATWRDLEAFAKENASRPGCGGLPRALERERELLRDAGGAEARFLDAWRAKAGDLNEEFVPPLGLAGTFSAIRRADGLARVGRYSDAEPLARHGVDAAEALGWPLARARGDRILASCLSSAGRLDEALALLERAQRDVDACGTDLDRIVTSGVRANVLRQLDRNVEALAVADALLSSDIATRTPLAAVDAQLTRSNALFSLNSLVEAADAARQALRGALEIGEPERHMIALSALGSALAQRGQTGGALSCIERYLGRARRARALNHVSTALETLGKLRLVLEDLDGALAAFREALEICESTGASRRAASLHQLVGNTLVTMGDLPGGERELRLALRSAAERRDRLLAVHVCRSLASVEEERRDFERALFEYSRARALAARIGDRFCFESALGTAANLEAKLGRPGEALPRFAEAIAIARQEGFRSEEALRHAERAGAFAKLGRWRESLDDCLRALDLLDAQRNGLGELETAGLQATEAAVTSNGAIAAGRLLREGGDGARGLESIVFGLAERSRARTLLEALTAKRNDVCALIPPDVLRAERVAAKRVTASHASPSDEDYAEWVRAVARVQRALASAGVPRAATPIAMDAWQATLAEDTAFITFVDGGDDLLAIALTRQGHHVAVIPARAEIERTIAAFVGLVSSPLSSMPDVVAAGAPLRDALLGPFENQIAAASRLEISPCGSLSRLPFEALPDRSSATEGERFLVDRVEVAYAPSASVQAWLRARSSDAGTGALVVSAPAAAGLAALRHAQPEAEAVASFFAADDVRMLPSAREASVRDALAASAGRRRAVHFACHGTVEPERPLLSSLRLAPEPEGSADDARLTAIEISRLRIPADVAMLSACRTSEGPWRPGEGVAGLVRAFLLAGCDRVVVSQWSVEDEATRALAEAFYKGLCRQGLPPATALRRAKLTLRSRSVTPRPDVVASTRDLDLHPPVLRGSLEPAKTATRAQWSHPYFWSAFVLWGRSD